MKNLAWLRFRTLACGFLLLPLPLAQALSAGKVVASDDTSLAEVVVTAQRRTENLQNVPIAATVLNGDTLADKGVQGIVSLQYAAPSLTVADYGSANVLNIRGVGRSAVDIELPSGVVLYRDGVPTFPGYFQNEPYFDIAEVEVLRGPQGTFVGKSAAGGAIFIRTAAPSLAGLSGRVEGEIGNFGQAGGTAVINVPLSDTFAIRVAMRELKRNKPMVDSLTGPYTGQPGEPDLRSYRFGALWKPNDNFVSQIRIDSSDLNFGGNLTSSYGYPLYDVVQDADFAYRDRSLRAVGDVRYTLDNGTVLSSVTGYQRTHTLNNFDRNGSQPRVDIFDSQGVFRLWSEEVNLISPDEGALTYVVGVFAQRTESDIFDVTRKGFNFTGQAGDLGGFVQSSDFPYLGLATPYTKREDETSAFVDFKYTFLEQWIAELGVRYSKYKLTNHTDIVIGDGTALPSIPFFAGDQQLNENDVDAKLSLTYKISPEQNLYVIAARAHVNGGFNIVGGAPFGKEQVYSYEGGWKATWLGGQLRTQFGGYYQTLSDYQAQFSSVLLPGQNILQNGFGRSVIYGLESSTQARFGSFNVDAGISLLRSKLGTYPAVVSPFLPAPDNIISISGGRAPFAPEFTFDVGASYAFDLASNMSLTPRIDVSHKSDQSGSLIVAPQTHLDARTLVNSEVHYAWKKWYAEAYVTNMFDKRYVAGIQDSGNIWYPGALRQYGLRFGVTF
jgi:iron complex outermembrane receptor protein